MAIWSKWMKRFLILYLFLILTILPLFAEPNVANLPTSSVVASAEIRLPGISDLVPKSNELKEAGQKLQEKLLETRQIEPLKTSLDGIVKQLDLLKERFQQIKQTNSYGFEQVAAIRASVRDLNGELQKLLLSSSARLEEIERLKSAWTTREDVWKNWQSSIEIDSESAKKVFSESRGLIKDALKLFSGIDAPIVETQKKISERISFSANLLQEIDALLREMKKDMFRRSRPALFTKDFVSQFDSSLMSELSSALAVLIHPESDFFSNQGWLIFVQIFLIFSIYLGMKNLSFVEERELKWRFVTSRPFSAALLMGIVFLNPFYETPEKSFQIVMIALAAISTTNLASGLVEDLWRRRVLYVLAGLYIFSQFSAITSIPTPIFRIYVTIVSLIGMLTCFWRTRLIKKELKASGFYLLVSRFLSGLFLIIFLTQASGYASFANHLMDASVKSVFAVLFAWMFNLLFKGGIEAAFENKFVHRFRIINKYEKFLITRMGYLIDIVVGFFAFATILSIWQIYDSSFHAASSLINLGFTIQEQRVTVGLIATAIGLFWLILFFSWLTQRILEEEVYPRQRVETGVGYSINRLIHYAFVLTGLFVSSSTLGIDFQNIAVLVGALGIGIGFGLQNIVNNFASGLILLFERSIKVGDVVQLNGEWGQIKSLGLRATIVETFDRSEMIVPNSDLVASTVVNWTMTDRQTRLIVKVGVAYGSDVENTVKTLQDIARENPMVMRTPEPMVLFADFGASSLDFELRVWVADLDNRLKVKNELNKAIDKRFKEEKIEIAFPQQDLHIRSIDEEAAKTIGSLNSSRIAEKKDDKKS